MMREVIIEDLALLIGDINARCPMQNSLLDKETFMSTMSGLERVSEALESSFFAVKQCCYKLLGAVVNYELLYAEM